MKKIKISITKDNLNFSEIREIYRETGWVKPDEIFNEKSVEMIVKKSFCFACAFSGKKIIGIGRAISDGTSDAYIQDVAVLEPYRNQGIGKKILIEILEFLKLKKIGWIGLIAEPGSSGFYENIGFKKMKKHIPMTYDLY
ncbi:MAG TPA: GNAT family N-acetyltransferase [bacterium]|nr:GNAT family N-acetyltransferase [bacterium]HPN31524.1 GNAT family N-acetyltransferase [bacterium]